jgi:hypothetical protein
MQADRDEGVLELSPEERREMVAVAAYYLAERRGFPGSGALDDWIAAERQIERMIEGMRNSGVTRHTLARVGLRNALRLWGQEE